MDTLRHGPYEQGVEHGKQLIAGAIKIVLRNLEAGLNSDAPPLAVMKDFVNAIQEIAECTE